MPFVTGVDVGGTFTDCAVIDGEGRITTSKAHSTPHDFSEGAVESLRLVGQTLGLTLDRLAQETVLIVHGTTVGDNAFLTRTGAKTGLVTTVGHRDAILIMRGGMGRVAGLTDYELHNPVATSKPEPIVARPLIEQVAERVDCTGEVMVPLDVDEVRSVVRKLVSKGAESIAVSLLWSFLNPAHEQRIKEVVIGEHPGIYVSVSSELVPVIGEYERTATTAIDCYVGPLIGQYIAHLSEKLVDVGFRCPLLIMQADGGVAYPKETVPVKTMQSGPVAGVVASRYLAALLGYRDAIATDMGGTSFKLALLVNGNYSFAQEFVFGQYHILTPAVDVDSIGAGGGSYAWVDVMGYLRVGPRSAGANPGPACYGLGGEEPTVTDADLLLGYLNPKAFLGGRMMLHEDKARKASQRVADQLGMDPVEVASGIYAIVNSQMADMIRKATIEKGHDPRAFTLFAYGGAGPVHVSGFGRELGVKSILIPNMSAVHSAFGLVASDVAHSFELSDPMRAPFNVERFNQNFEKMEAMLVGKMRGEGIRDENIALSRGVKMRYRRQVHVVPVPVPVKRLSEDDIASVCDAFERKYGEIYGEESAFREAGIECITFGVVATGATGFKPEIARYESAGPDATHALKGERQAYFRGSGGFLTTKVYAGPMLKCGNVISGPAIVEMPGTTVVVQPGQRLKVDSYLNFVVTEAD